MKYHFKFYHEGRGFWAQCLELKGCHTQGSSLEELKRNMKEALNLYLKEPFNSKTVFSLPKKNVKGSRVVAIVVEPKIAFAFYLRRLRLKYGFTQQEVAKKLGFKNLYSYQRLENPKTANPELATIIQLKKVFPDFSVDDILAA